MSTGSGENPQSSRDSRAEPFPILLTIQDVAKNLQKHPRSVHRMVKNELMPQPVRIGNSLRWKRDEFLQWIDEGCRPASESAVQ